MRSPLLAAWLAVAVPAVAQPPAPTEPASGESADPQRRDPAPLSVAETVDVVAVTPVDGTGLPRWRVPANVQIVQPSRLGDWRIDIATVLAHGIGSLHVSEAQGGTFQPDVLFRGFTGSPLLGASEGLAVYQDGVRVNEPFGDVVNWEALPPVAVESIQVIPGSNPLYGLNTLGGAVSIRSRDGFTAPGGRLAVSAGSFGRVRGDGDWGGRRGRLAAYAAVSWIDEQGWRDESPSTLRRLFGKASWQGAASRTDVTALVSSNDLLGNGTVPVGLLAERRAAVFTHPDRTENDTRAFNARFDRFLSPFVRIESTAYARPTRLATLNGDADDGDGDGDEGGDGQAADRDASEGIDGVLNRSRTRSNAAGGTMQMVVTRPVRGRDHQLIVGASLDGARSHFGFSAEAARLSPSRGAIGAGIFDDEAAIGLRTRTRTAALFVSDTIELREGWHATVSARANWSAVTLLDQLGTALDGDHRFARLNPAVGLTWDVRPSLNVFGGVAESSRVPTPVELTCADPEDPCRLPNAFVSDPPLAQVVARTWEGGVRGRWRTLSWTAAAFATRVADDLIFVSSGTVRGAGHFENVARTQRRGLETGAEWRAGAIGASGTYTWQRAAFGTALSIASPFHPDAVDGNLPVPAGAAMPAVPAHVGRVTVSGPVGPRLAAALSLRAQSSQVLRGDEANRLPAVPGFATVDVLVRWRAARRATLVVQATNLFDDAYETFGGLGSADLLGDAYEDDRRFLSPAAPRAAWVGVEIAF
jgi:iron complex outermembrane receptor protein